MDQTYVVEHQHQHQHHHHRNRSGSTSALTTNSFDGDKGESGWDYDVEIMPSQGASDEEKAASDRQQQPHRLSDQGNAYDERADRHTSSMEKAAAAIMTPMTTTTTTTTRNRRQARDSSETLVGSTATDSSDNEDEEGDEGDGSRKDRMRIDGATTGVGTHPAIEGYRSSPSTTTTTMRSAPEVSLASPSPPYAERSNIHTMSSDASGRSFGGSASREKSAGEGDVGKRSNSAVDASAAATKASKPLTLIERHASLLSLIAHKEAQVRRTRLVLQTQEADLDELRERWQNVAARSLFKSTTTTTVSGGAANDGGVSKPVKIERSARKVSKDNAISGRDRDRARRRQTAASSSLTLEIPSTGSSSLEATPTGSPMSSTPSTPLASQDDLPPLSATSSASGDFPDSGSTSSHQRNSPHPAPARSMPSIFGQFIGQLQSVVEDAMPALALVAGSSSTTSPIPPSSASTFGSGPDLAASSHQTPKARTYSSTDSGGSSLKAAARASLEAARDAKRLSASSGSSTSIGGGGMSTPIAPLRNRPSTHGSGLIPADASLFASPLAPSKAAGVTPRTLLNEGTPRRGHRPLSLLVNRQQQNQLLEALEEAERDCDKQKRPKTSMATCSAEDENRNALPASPGGAGDYGRPSRRRAAVAANETPRSPKKFFYDQHSRSTVRDDINRAEDAPHRAVAAYGLDTPPAAAALSWRHRLEDVLKHPTVKASTNRASSYLSANFGETLQLLTGTGGGGSGATTTSGAESYISGRASVSEDACSVENQAAVSASTRSSHAGTRTKQSIRAEYAVPPSPTLESCSMHAILQPDIAPPSTSSASSSQQQVYVKRNPPLPVNAGRLRPLSPAFRS